MQILVQVDPSLATALRRGLPPAQALFDAAAALGLALRPVHPTVDAPPLGTWFTAELPAGDASAAADRLRAVPGVTSAYAKAKDAPA